MQLDDLVRRAKQGDLHAHGKLVELTQTMVYAVVRRIVRDLDDALDVTQDVYLRAFRRLRDLEEPAAFPGWLRRIAVTCAQSHLRARPRWFVNPETICASLGTTGLASRTSQPASATEFAIRKIGSTSTTAPSV